MRTILIGGIFKALESERMTMYMELTLLDRNKAFLLLDKVLFGCESWLHAVNQVY